MSPPAYVDDAATVHVVRSRRLCVDDSASVPRSPGRLFAALPTYEALASRITLDEATFDAAEAAERFPGAWVTLSLIAT